MDAHAFRFLEQNIFWKKLKIEKISFDPSCVNKFYDMIKIQKNDAHLFENLNLQKKKKMRKIRGF